MTAFVSLPNLPKACSAVIYGEKYASFLEKPLKEIQISSIFVPDNVRLDPRLAGHADLSILHLGGERLLLAPTLKGSGFARELYDAGALVEFPDVQQTEKYPDDAQYNVCIVGRNVIFHRAGLPDCFVEYLTIEPFEHYVNCKQGYTRCAICIVDANALITADRGIAKAAEASGFDVLLIEPGFIRLDGFPYGFIGGASFKLSQNTLAFTGSLDAHPDCDRILRFLRQHGIKALFLTQEPIFDIGTAIPIFEKA